jgi:hypothetical protein
MHPRKWHTNLLILFLAGWSLVSLVGVSVLMIRAPVPVDPADCLLFLWTPILIGWASWLLFRQHRYQALPLCIVPAMYIMTAVRLSQGRLSCELARQRVEPDQLSPRLWPVRGVLPGLRVLCRAPRSQGLRLKPLRVRRRRLAK